MSKKNIKLRESQILDIVSKVITEQTANDVTVAIVGKFGQAQNKFSGLEKFVGDMISKINEQLQGETPYYIRRVKKGQSDGIISEHDKSGDNFLAKVNLVPTTEEDRHFRFTCAAAIYSEAVDFNALANEVQTRASRKSNNFNSVEKYYLGYDHLDLKNFQNLNPDAPNKEYKLLLFYYAGSTPPKFDK